MIREGLRPSLDFNQFFSSSWQLDIQSESVGQVGIVSVKGGLPRAVSFELNLSSLLFEKVVYSRGLLQSREEIEFGGEWDLVSFEPGVGKCKKLLLRIGSTYANVFHLIAR